MNDIEKLHKDIDDLSEWTFALRAFKEVLEKYISPASSVEEWKIEEIMYDINKFELRSDYQKKIKKILTKHISWAKNECKTELVEYECRQCWATMLQREKVKPKEAKVCKHTHIQEEEIDGYYDLKSQQEAVAQWDDEPAVSKIEPLSENVNQSHENICDKINECIDAINLLINQ